MLFYLFMLTAHADDEPKVVYKKETEIDFEAIELEGALVKPQGALLLERKRASFNPLIELRKDFDKEMRDSVREIK
tara:strand:+ start:2533 stop:2760 length:228 start_codon:yes stop_codon:yes gene_type:complete